MTTNNSIAEPKTNWVAQAAYFLLRVVSGLLLSQAGALILFGWFGGTPDGPTVRLLSETGIGGVLEVVCGLAIMLGLLTRPGGFLFFGVMAGAVLPVYSP